jgi:hypothetical protein
LTQFGVPQKCTVAFERRTNPQRARSDPLLTNQSGDFSLDASDVSLDARTTLES